MVEAVAPKPMLSVAAAMAGMLYGGSLMGNWEAAGIVGSRFAGPL